MNGGSDTPRVNKLGVFLNRKNRASYALRRIIKDHRENSGETIRLRAQVQEGLR